MKFLYADSLDFVDPDYDFIRDRHSPRRRPHEDDQYPHEHLDVAPYDGLLISRAIVGGSRHKGGKYSASQAIRFTREGARRFLRYPEKRFPNSMVMGDCGAFSYRNLPLPPHGVDDMLEFYEDGGFTHGCSVDHVILTFDEHLRKPDRETLRRYDLTLDNARAFLKESKGMHGFVPVGVIQGWSPSSMADAASQLARMGYKYLAIGGLVPLKIDQISRALIAIREAIPSRIKLHALGFGKTEDLDVLRSNRVDSFDTTSPLFRAFKDGKKNYYSLRADGNVDYYTAVRIPQAIDNLDLIRHARRGRFNQDRLLTLETTALDAVRQFSRRACPVTEAVDAVLAYGRYALWKEKLSEEKNEARLHVLSQAYTKTLNDRPWERCACRVCRELGVEVLIFRSSNRNKRRGIHNLHIFFASVCAADARKQ